MSWCATEEEALADGAPIVDATHFAALLASHQEDGPPSKIEFRDVDGEHVTAAIELSAVAAPDPRLSKVEIGLAHQIGEKAI